MALGIGLTLAGCAATQPDKAVPSGFLKNYAQLTAGGGDRALLTYVNPSTDFAAYTTIMVDPVTIWTTASTRTIPADEAQILADDLDDALRVALQLDYKLVDRPGPGVLRLRAAITEAEGSWHVEDAVGSKLDPDLRGALPPKPSGETRGFVGKAGVEGEVLDSLTGERLLAAVDRRAGERRLRPDADEWDDVEDAFRYWAERLRKRLAELRGRPADH